MNLHAVLIAEWKVSCYFHFGSVLCSNVCSNCAQCNAHTWTDI